VESRAHQRTRKIGSCDRATYTTFLVTIAVVLAVLGRAQKFSSASLCFRVAQPRPHRAIVVSFVYYNALEEPHRCSPISTRTMNAGWLPGSVTALRKLSTTAGRVNLVGRKMNEINARSLDGRRFALKVGALFRR